MTHPCLSCGACCAWFKVAFHWFEASPELGGQTPQALTETLDRHRLVMRGTQAREPRCVALVGEVGRDARCSIYAQRPSPCHALQPAWAAGVASPQCDRARQAHGLLPLAPGWHGAVSPTSSLAFEELRDDTIPAPAEAALVEGRPSRLPSAMPRPDSAVVDDGLADRPSP